MVFIYVADVFNWGRKQFTCLHKQWQRQACKTHLKKIFFSSPCLKRRIETTGSPLCRPGLTVRVGAPHWRGRVSPACQEETSVCRLLPAKAVSLNSEKGCVVPRLWEPAWGDSCPGHCGHLEAWQSKVQTDLATPLGSEEGLPILASSVVALLYVGLRKGLPCFLCAD